MLLGGGRGNYMQHGDHMQPYIRAANPAEVWTRRQVHATRELMMYRNNCHADIV